MRVKTAVKKSLEEIISDLIEFISPHLEGVDSVLDIGTGTSIPVHIVAENFTGIRFYTTDVVDIRERKKLPFLVYDGNHLPFTNSEFDISLLNETLHHCEEPARVLSEARRVAKAVYIIEHFPVPGTSMQEMMADETEALQNFNMTCSIYHPFTENSLARLFRNAGLEVFARAEVPYGGSRRIRKFLFKVR